MKKFILFIGLICFFCCSCHRVIVPKPYGYVRITTPDTVYVTYSGSEPFHFALSQNAQVISQAGEKNWLNIQYPSLKTTIHGSCFPIQGDLDILTNEAVDLVYRHAAQATAIPEQAFVNEEEHVYGVLFRLQGNAASPFQFFLTDSVHHFFRASVYCECRPNADSLAPIYDYLEKDIKRIIESWQWVR